jgi:outer membrane protein OmpA-like peptidoglycan-associated protein
MNPTRRDLHRLALAVLALAAGCASPPPPSPPSPPPPGLTPRQVERLQSLGFTKVDDGWQLTLGASVLFGFGSDALSSGVQDTIGKLAGGLAEVGLLRARVEGHTDSVGGDEANQALSQRRAEAVARAMAAHGMPATGLITRGFGKSKPIADNQSEAGRAQNRRVAIIVPSA